MTFKNETERKQWLKDTATKIYQMEYDREICILSGNQSKAFSLLKGIKFARQKFAEVSKVDWNKWKKAHPIKVETKTEDIKK